MTGRPVPKRHWRSYGDDPLPTGQQALREPLRESIVATPARTIAA